MHEYWEYQVRQWWCNWCSHQWIIFLSLLLAVVVVAACSRESVEYFFPIVLYAHTTHTHACSYIRTTHSAFMRWFIFQAAVVYLCVRFRCTQFMKEICNSYFLFFFLFLKIVGSISDRWLMRYSHFWSASLDDDGLVNEWINTTDKTALTISNSIYLLQ